MASVEGSNLDASYATLFIREHNLESRPASILKDKRRGGSILWIKLVPNVPAAAVAAGLEDTFRSKANKLAADQQFAEAERIIWRGTLSDGLVDSLYPLNIPGHHGTQYRDQ
jgi:hypothetical protein